MNLCHNHIALARFTLIVMSVSALVETVPGRAQTNPATIREELAAHTAHLPFTMPQVPVPVFPEQRLSVTEYGAVGDGHTMNTKSFADAIVACGKLGGGTVVIPQGTWLTGPIKLESNINLYLERGALIQFSNRIEDFPIIAGLDGKSKRYVVTPPIYAYKAKNIAITGEGIFDGAGEIWRYVKKEKQTERQWKKLISSGGVVNADGKEWWPSREAMDGEEYLKELEKSKGELTAADYAKVREYLRPDLVQLVQCDGILLDGPTFQNSPKFHVHPIQSENIIVRNVKILSPWHAQNGDGLDPTSCRNVIVYNTTVDAGDDGICLKPGSIAKSQKPGPSCENIVIVDCVVYHAHGGFVIGSESFGGVNNVSVRNCVFIGTDVGVRFKSLRGKGGLVENVFIDGIQMREIANEAILFDMYYGGGAPEVETTKERGAKQEEAVTSLTPRFQNISFKNIVCNGADRAVALIGLPEMPIKNVTFDNVSISARQGLLCVDVDGIRFDGCRITHQSGPAIMVDQSRNITVEGGMFPGAAEIFLRVDGEKSENIHLVGIEPARTRNAIELGKNVKADAVKRD